MEASNISPLLLAFFLLSLLQTSTIAIDRKSYIVYLGSQSSLASASLLDTRRITESHYNLLGSLVGSKKVAEESIFYSYTKSFNGFAATLDENEASNLAKNPQVISVFENRARKLHTTHSWNFLGLENAQGVPPPNSLWNAAKFGEDIIIANIDSGVWPESKSFSDEGYGPIPAKWKGTCQTDLNFHCNKKLIGGRYFYKGYEAGGAKLSPSSLTVRDHDGHGTHTLSTAGGNFVPGANVFGQGNGTAKGGAPRARVAAYKACWPPLAEGECFDADILAAYEAAIADGADVISTSLGGGSGEFADDPLAIAPFHAMEQGIVTVFSAGNDGPDPETVSNVSPWKFTVAASTMDRDFASYIALGNKKRIKGASLASVAPLPKKFYPLIDSKAGRIISSNVTDYSALVCGQGTLDPAKVKGKILVCLEGGIPGFEKGIEANRVGAVGLIVVNDKFVGDNIFPELHFLPASDVKYSDRLVLTQYMESTRNPMGHLMKVRTEVGIKPAPVMASFSSRGPNPIERSILKPDITAPGVNILAAYSSGTAPTTSRYDRRRIPFSVISGTSMSCPHISGIAALLKSIHPQWSPAAIKSAIMTTAKTRDNNLQSILDSTKVKATPLAYGAGHVQPNNAMDPGLVYDATVKDYLNFLCARGYTAKQIRRFYAKSYVCDRSFKLTDLNYPSISVSNLTMGPVTVNRRVKNVGSPGTYVARVKVGPGVSISVEPSTLQFSIMGEEKAFKVVFQYKGNGKREGYMFGTLIWSDGKHFVRSPIVMNLGE